MYFKMLDAPDHPPTIGFLKDFEYSIEFFREPFTTSLTTNCIGRVVVLAGSNIPDLILCGSTTQTHDPLTAPYFICFDDNDMSIKASES